MRWAVLGLLLAACSEDCEWWYDHDCRAEQAPPPPGPPSVAGALASEDAIRLHAGGLPRLLASLDAPGTAAIGWPGGYDVEIEVLADGTFENDPVRDGIAIRGAFVRQGGAFVDGWVEIDGGLRFESWDLVLPIEGRVEVRGGGATGVLRWPGDGFGYYTGTYREPGTSSVPVQFSLGA